MKRTLWMTTVAFVLAALWLRTGVAWAQPTGAANVLQILNVRTFKGASEERTFLTIDVITFEATFYDPNPTCVAAVPFLRQLLLFNLEGQLLFTFNVGPITIGSGYTVLARDPEFGASTLPAGNYKFVFLVKDCTNVNFIVSDFHVIRVLAL